MRALCLLAALLSAATALSDETDDEAGTSDASGNNSVMVLSSLETVLIAGDAGQSGFTHEFKIVRTDASAASSTYTMVADGHGFVTGLMEPMPQAQEPNFYLGNNGAALDVYLEYLQVCAP